MQNAPVVGQIHSLFGEREQHPEPEKPKPGLGLTWLDRLPLDALVSDDAANVVEQVRLSAEALAGDQADAARLRLLSRLLSATRAQVILLEAMINERLAKRDAGGVDLINKVLNGASKRLVLLLAEHRASCASGRRASVVVAVGNAEHVTVHHEE